MMMKPGVPCKFGILAVIALTVALSGCFGSEKRAEVAEAAAEHAQASAARAEEAAAKALEASQAAAAASDRAAKAVEDATKSINETAARIEEMQHARASRPRGHQVRRRTHATATAAASPAGGPSAAASPAR